MESFFSRFSLRTQAALAVVLPCVVVALFASVYFPRRLNEQAARALEQQIESIGLLAVANAAPTMRLIRDGLANPDELDAVFAGVRAGGNIVHAGALAVSAQTAVTEAGHRYVVVSPTAKAQVRGDLAPGRYEVPAEGQ